MLEDARVEILYNRWYGGSHVRRISSMNAGGNTVGDLFDGSDRHGVVRVSSSDPSYRRLSVCKLVTVGLET